MWLWFWPVPSFNQVFIETHLQSTTHRLPTNLNILLAARKNLWHPWYTLKNFLLNVDIIFLLSGVLHLEKITFILIY